MTDTRLRRTLSGTLTAGLLLVGGLGATSAIAEPKDKTPDQQPDDHPSGKDRSAERGGSGTQGKSTSDPDGDSNGGMDKPGHTGGYDADRDGNNGCGNDDDFEDDNNGLCGGRHLGAERRPAGDVDDTDVAGDDLAKTPVVRPDSAGSDAGPTSTTLVGRAAEASVLGIVLTRSADGRITAAAAGDATVLDTTLPRTGAETATIMVAGVLLVLVGTATVAAGRVRVS